MRHFYPPLLILIVLFVSCEIKPINSIDTDKVLVISGYLYPLDDVVQISVRKPLLIGVPQNINTTDITDATVRIQVRKKTYDLLFNPKSIYYEAPTMFKASDTVKLTVSYKGIVATSETIIPKQITNITFSQLNEKSIKFSWPNNGTNYSQIFTERVFKDGRRVNPDYISTNPYLDFFRTDGSEKVVQNIGFVDPLPEGLNEISNITGQILFDTELHF